MKLYLLSLSAGILVGVVYSLLGVKSPAPPVVALVGLLGILFGEHAVSLTKRLAHGPTVAAMIKTKCTPENLGSQADPYPKSRKPSNE